MPPIPIVRLAPARSPDSSPVIELLRLVVGSVSTLWALGNRGGIGMESANDCPVLASPRPRERTEPQIRGRVRESTTSRTSAVGCRPPGPGSPTVMSCSCPGAGTHVTTLRPGEAASRFEACCELPATVGGVAGADLVDRGVGATVARSPARTPPARRARARTERDISWVLCS